LRGCLIGLTCQTPPRIVDVANRFFEDCETGKGWEGYNYCTPDASFTAQLDVKTLRDYADWMEGLLSFMPDGRYALKSFAAIEQRQNVCAYGVFSATDTGQGGPLPPTGKSTTTDYVYVMEFTGDKIHHTTKIWNAPWAMKQQCTGSAKILCPRPPRIEGPYLCHSPPFPHCPLHIRDPASKMPVSLRICDR
jgi:predicted ester cyclase